MIGAHRTVEADFPIGPHGFDLQPPDTLGGAQDAAAQGVVAEVEFAAAVVGPERRLVVVLEDLLDDHLFLGLEVLGPQRRSQHVGPQADDPILAEIREVAAVRGTKVVNPRRGEERQLAGGAALSVVHPPEAEPPVSIENSLSLVLLTRVGDGSMLLTGDIHRDAEEMLLHEGRSIGADILKLGHHGSRTSSSAPFLAGVNPRLAVVSCGFGNIYGHPNREVTDRLEARGVRVLRTDLDGTIRVEISPDGRIRFETERARFATP